MPPTGPQPSTPRLSRDGAAPRSLDDLLEAYAAASAQERAVDAAAARRGEIDRLLAPIGTPAVLPPEIERVVRALASPTSPSRADALALQLRHLVGAERVRQAKQDRDRTDADRLLTVLDEIILESAATNEAVVYPTDLDAVRQSLALVAAGLVHLGEPLAERARALALELRRERDKRVQAIAADVLEGTLKDLGFVVEPIANTLFVAGGVAHFTRPEWGDYAVRLRANATDGTLNFNVVREDGSESVDALSTRIRDTVAEETWCAHIPKLTETLESRGIKLNVRRMLSAGEAPAQVVPKGTLAPLTTEPTRRAATTPLKQGLS